MFPDQTIQSDQGVYNLPMQSLDLVYRLECSVCICSMTGFECSQQTLFVFRNIHSSSLKKYHFFFIFLNDYVYCRYLFGVPHQDISNVYRCLCREIELIWIPLLCSILGPAVQSIVSLTSLLRVISLTVLADSIYNILIFFAEKM